MKPVSHRKQFAKKSLGQNFLHDPRSINNIIKAVAPAPQDTIVETGPGRGALTGQLVHAGARVVDVELATNLALELSERFEGSPRVLVMERDVLDIDFRSVTNRPPANEDSSNGAQPFFDLDDIQMKL